jgi:dTDP-4-amino-4,6-dideoxygalactose transaminase
MKIEAYSPTIRRKEMDAVLTAMVEDRIGPGEQAKFLVQVFREKIKFDYCLSLRSPAIALYLALKSLNLERGQGVLISALSPLYYGQVIESLALVPHYCDVSFSTACVSRETVSKAIMEGGQNIKCMVLYHTLGFVPEAGAVAELGFPVIEDCSLSYGTETEEPSALAFTPVFSVLGLEERDMLTSGGGALLYSANRRDSSLLRGLGNLPPEYGLPDMNAALAVVQFREAAKNLLKRRDIAALYTQSAAITRHKMFTRQGTGYNNYAFPLILETGMNDVKAYARRKDIVVESAFENTLAASGAVPREKCPHAYSLSLRTVLFPLYPRLGMAKAGKVAKLIMTLP